VKINRRRLLSIALAALVLAAAGWTAWNVWASRDLELAIGELRAAGLPTSPRELYPPTVPEAENAAHLYEASFAMMKNLPDLRNDEWWDDLPKVPPEVRAALPAFGEALDLTHRAGRLPACRFELRYEDGLTMRIAHVPQMRKLGQLLAARAAVRVEEGSLDGAQEDLRALFALTRALRDEPIMVTQVVRFKLAKRGLDVLETVLARSGSRAAVLDRVRPDDCRGGVSRGLRGEVVLRLSLLDWGMLDAAPPEAVPTTLRIPGLRGPTLKSSLARMARHDLGCVRAVERPYPEAIALLKSLEEKCSAEADALSGLLLASYSNAVKREAEVAATLERIRSRS